MLLWCASNTDADLDTPDGRYFFSTGILTIIFLCLTFYGAIGVALFALHEIQGLNPARSPAYYRGRQVFYSVCFICVGIFRFLMPGAKVLHDLGSGPLDKPFVVVGGPMWFPEIEIALGVTCVLLGVWGCLRGLGMASAEDGSFGYAVGFNYVLYFVLKVLVQVGYFPAGMGPGAAPATISVVFLPGHLILAFLDDKGREPSLEADYKEGDKKDLEEGPRE